MPLFQLSEDLVFPDPNEAEPNGLLAVGGDLQPERLLLAYRQGIFPWFDNEKYLLWWSPDPRGVFFPEDFHISRSLQRILQKNPFQLVWNQNFAGVVNCCASIARKGQSGTWILPKMLEAYQALYHQGFAHSIAIYAPPAVNRENELWGGLYGVRLGRVFFAESMFSKRPNGSKVALAFLVEWAKKEGIGLIDCQFLTEHLSSLGAVNITRKDYLVRLGALV